MSGHIPIPGHITAIYIFAVVNLMALFHITLVEANIIVLDRLNKTIEELPDLEAQFGPAFPEQGLWGHIVYVTPHNACLPITPPPTDNLSGINWIALIKRSGCNFDEKVLNAQTQGYAAALVHNVGSDELVPMGPGKHGNEIHIPSAFIGERDGIFLWENFDRKTDFYIVIDNDPFPNVNMYLIPFAIVVGICFVLMLVFMIIKWVRDIRKRQRSRLSKEKLKKLPIKKFKKGDHYDVCAICLDEYEEGEKLRVLPCAHAYHMKCVDPWLTKNKRTCPVCKRKVIPGDHEDSESDSDSDEEGRESETTPLLTAQSANQVPRYHHAFDNPDLPENLSGQVNQASSSDTDSDTTVEGAVGGTPSTVEVHPTPSPTDGRQAPTPTRARRGYGSTTVAAAREVNDNTSVNSFFSEEEGEEGVPPTVARQGAVGGVASETDSNVEFNDNYYSEQEMKGVVSGGETSGDDLKKKNDSPKVRILGKNKKQSKKKRRNDNA